MLVISLPVSRAAMVYDLTLQQPCVRVPAAQPVYKVNFTTIQFVAMLHNVHFELMNVVCSAARTVTANTPLREKLCTLSLSLTAHTAA
jgi:hypothetical protein